MIILNKKIILYINIHYKIKNKLKKKVVLEKYKLNKNKLKLKIILKNNNDLFIKIYYNLYYDIFYLLFNLFMNLS